MIKAALFDLDGVVFETESQYTIFWGMIGREYHPEMPDFAHRIKGQTLVQIYDKYFSDAQTFAHIERLRFALMSTSAIWHTTMSQVSRTL